MDINKMVKEILDERILNDGLNAKGWKKYNDGILKAVQVIKEYQSNNNSQQNGHSSCVGCMNNGDDDSLCGDCGDDYGNYTEIKQILK